MVVCGVKLTHDSNVALIDNGKLVFSVETEKRGNADRHAEIHDLSQVSDLLAAYNVSMRDLDVICFDGWRSPELTCKWDGQEVRIGNAPYRRGFTSDAPLRPYTFRLWDLEYVSFPHYSGHVVGGYCASPYAAAGDDAYVLCWDGAMFPYLYMVSAEQQKVESRGIVFHLLGDAYHQISQLYHPFDGDITWPRTLVLPGKIMAYVARGSVARNAVKKFSDAYERVSCRLRAGQRDDQGYTEVFGRRILQALKQEIGASDESDANMLASWHQYLESLLVERVGRMVEDSARRERRNLVIVGGCALNIKWNRALRDCGVFDSTWVPPFANDSGSGIGAACCAMTARRGLAPLSWNVYSGPEIEVGQLPKGWHPHPCTIQQLAQLLYETGEPVVFLNGRAEVGPRALGNRSILASPAAAGMKDNLNRLKEREDYRPVAPVCLRERVAAVFDPGDADPYMLFDQRVRPAWRDRVPAICHEDGTARVQTVSEPEHPLLFQLLREFERLSGLPLLCNTSANWSGRGFFPDVQSAAEWGRVPHIWCGEILYRREPQDGFVA